MEKDLKTKFKYQEKELRKIINSWNLISGSPSDEFDSLNHKLLSHLIRGVDKEKLTRVLYSDLITYYGLSVDHSDAEELATEVLDWWSENN